MEDKDITKVSEAVVARPTTSYADVMSYLHTIDISPEDKKKVANRLTLEVNGSNFSRIFERLDYLASLSNNWDGYGALPVSRKVIGNIKAILLISDDEDWQDWLIGAEPNATIAIQAKTKVASISIGNKEFSYYANIDGKESGDSHVVFSPESVLNLMRSFDHE